MALAGLAAKKELLWAIAPDLRCRLCDGIPRPGETSWYQCFKGHFICQPCRKKAPKRFVLGLPSMSRICGCKAIMVAKPNEIIGRLITTLPFQCLFSKNGCDEVLYAEDLPNHKKNCKYRDLQCFICKETIAFNQLIEHLESAHEESQCKFRPSGLSTFKIIEQRSDANDENQVGAKEKLQIWSKLRDGEGRIFFEFGVQHEELLHRWVYYFGPKEEASQFYYVAHFKANRGEVLSYQGIARSVDENFDDIIEDQSTFNVGVKSGRRLFTGLSMEYTLTIRKIAKDEQNDANETVDGLNDLDTADNSSFNFELQDADEKPYNV